MPAPLADIDTELGTITFEDIELDIECESVHEREVLHLDPHPADLYSISPCGRVMAMCYARRTRLFMEGMWRCVGADGCGEPHYVNQIRWEPIKP